MTPFCINFSTWLAPEPDRVVGRVFSAKTLLDHRFVHIVVEFHQIVGIARKNGALSDEQCNELVEEQRLIGEGDAWRPVSEICLERGLLSEDQIDRIVQGERYMQIRAADRHLGEICEMMGLAERGAIKECLQDQKNAYRESGSGDLPRLGDLLLDRGFIDSEALVRATRVHEKTRDPSRRLEPPDPEVIESGVRPGDSGRYIGEILAEFGIDRKAAEEKYRQEIEIYVECSGCGRSNLRSSSNCRRCESALR